ncbi:MAG: cell wall hydrolase [Pseudomonadota bacterium]
METIEEIATLEPMKPAHSRIAGALPYVLAGAALVVGVAVFGSYMGKSAVARSGPGTAWTDVTQPSVTLVSRASLSESQYTLEDQGYSFEIGQQVTASLKGDRITKGVFDRPDSILLRPAVLPMAKPRILAHKRRDFAIESPPARKLKAVFRRGQAMRDRARAVRQAQINEHYCMAKAIYFEARSESKAGQLAVANVVMNRVKSKNYPSTICGVVYENRVKKKRLGGCQFSFTCDGTPDRPRPGAQWNMARKLAHKVMDNDPKYTVVNSSVLHYHADYVNPRWSKFMRRLTKIGRHIFYTGT